MLCTADPPSGQLQPDGLQAADANPLTDKASPSLDEVRVAVAKLEGWKRSCYLQHHHRVAQKLEVWP